MTMRRGSKPQCKRHTASSAAHRRAAGHGIGRANFVCRSARISGVALGLACLFAISTQVRAQSMSGSTDDDAGDCLSSFGHFRGNLLPAVDRCSARCRCSARSRCSARCSCIRRPARLVHLQSARQPLGQAQRVADRQAGIARRDSAAGRDQKAASTLRRYPT